MTNCTVSLSENGLRSSEIEIIDRIAAWQIHEAELSSNFLGMFIADLVSIAQRQGIDAVCTDPKLVMDTLRNTIDAAEVALQIARKVMAPFPSGKLEPSPNEPPAAVEFLQSRLGVPREELPAAMATRGDEVAIGQLQSTLDEFLSTATEAERQLLKRILDRRGAVDVPGNRLAGAFASVLLADDLTVLTEQECKALRRAA